MQLFRTTCTNDWKGRPYHTLVLVATSDNRDVLLKTMADDVASWQSADLVSLQESWDQDIDLDFDEEEIEARGTRPTQWAEENVRWEMERLVGNDLREFVERIGEEFCTTVYHILD